MFFLSVAQQTNPSKFWGILNNKYVISDKELNIEGLKFIDKFNECTDCIIWEAYGPYLYENLNFMPRAFFIDNSILVIGDKQSTQFIHSLIADTSFDPKKAVILQSNKELINKYSIEELDRHNAVILTSQPDNIAIEKLKKYVENGGRLLPDIFNNKNNIENKDIINVFQNLSANYDEIEITNYENNRASYNVKDKRGYLVLSERFSNFPGWFAKGNNNKDIMIANGIITAVYVENDNEIIFKYKPTPFRNGLIISSVTLLIILIYFLYPFIRKLGDKNKN